MKIRLILLGGFHAGLPSGDTVSLPTRKARALLAYLALCPGQLHPRDKLATLLWGDTADAQARTSLRQSLAALRKALGAAAPAALVIDPRTVSLDPQAVDVDVVSFERLAADGTPRGLEEAVALYRGELLDGFDVSAPSFEEWLVAQRERLRELALEALARLLRHQSDASATEPAIQTALRLLTLDPLQEAVHRTLMRLYARQGRRSNALRQYQVCVGVLQRELGVEPEPETRHVYQDILQQRLSAAVKPGATAAPGRRPSLGVAPRRREAPSLEPPLVGREAELASLRQAMDDAGDGRGRAVAILGEAGIGKTRVLDELAAAALRRGSCVLSGRSYETERILPFGPWAEVLRAALASPEGAALDSLDPASQAELARLLPELAARGWKPEGPADDHLRLFGAVAHALHILSVEVPLVLIFEDLHWADEMSVRLFGFVARRIETWPGLLIASARDEELDEAPLLRRVLEELQTARHVVRMSLSPLSEVETYGLVRALARVGTPKIALGRVAAHVWAASAGNPFVAVETMRSHQDGDRLDPSRAGLPERVREAISGRLERLSRRARELVALSAVIGREFEFGLLQRAARLDEREAAEGVEELVRRRILHGVGTRLDFVHDRVREVADGGILPARRTLLHAAVGEAIETMYAEHLEPHQGALGTHYRHGEIWDKALTNLRQAGKNALACSANREAIAYFEQALAVLKHLPAGRSALQQSYDIQMYRAGVLFALGELDRILDHLGETDAIARSLDDETRAGRVAVLRLACLGAMGDQVRAIESGERGLAIAEASANLPLQVSATVLLGFAHTGLGNFEQAIGRHRQCAGLLERNATDHRLGQIAIPAVLWRSWLLIPLAEVGAFAEAVALGQESVRIANDAAQPYSLALAHGTLGYLYCLKGEPEAALVALERSVAVCREYETWILSPVVTAALGEAYALAGRVSDALPLLERGVALGPSLRVLWWHSRRVAALADGYLRAGRLGDARATGERAVALAETHGERGNRAWALRVLAAVALQSRPPDLESAEQHLREALEAAETLGMPPLAARCRLDLSRMYRGRGDLAAARAQLAVAHAQLADLEMGLWSAAATSDVAASAG